MELLIAFLGLVGSFGLLDLASLKWGRNSTGFHLTNYDPVNRSNW